MNNEISRISTIIGDPVRSVILWTLLDNRAYTAIELANVVETSPQNISIHLSKLVNADLLTVESQGRHKYYKLLNPEIAGVIEGIANLVPKERQKNVTDNNSGIKYCRTCYDHLAGKIGVEITAKLIDKKYIVLDNKAFLVTEEGKNFFNNLGIDLEALKKQKRIFAKPCLDWSERKHHLSGSLAAALLNKMFEMDWIRRIDNSRAVSITANGQKALYDKLKLIV
ncbi:ArsR/SmtB family transcription factor [Flavobacterium johnsoniae]|uniref:Transcriptional regulator, ArsR family n=1 Tax=Flavobacterium johnsoniae (strain ATCC 17061 / DSM 2064 / JCM 8514 / BCRC 14874 / CCUG 350202 / NBRC 14942 / NCIMB 11054 / UW101) TaxID=376686 RepID=A5FFQ3_FLAJ1|nr:winged helix-turn-helix domain-containing protein [Flavobacterium johnsoniae]ABQ05970.1 transcriptional regulator, ArsR family [Flavobacterium johnsoniae UW101]OXG00660.1 transcriptional regulator [Flavobacterium johnsoniae UW101]WQG81708.1 winged helix-turn-helix domain-containing protein [Flavobacterium johnsoniae UW101]SHK61743.1 transcriptional regulator, ArsR family [Flavobacterium johnsoniae]